MIGIGVIGYGYWGPNLVRNLAETPDAKVIAVSDLSQERLAQAESRHPTICATTDCRDLFTNPAIDAIVVATPVSTHYELAMQALQSGKHVLVEKPLTSTLDQGLRLLDEARRRNLVLMVDHTFIYTGAVRKIREIVQSGALGPIYYYDSVRINLGLFQRDINVLWDLAVHDLAIMDYVLDARPHAVSATGIAHINENEDVAYLTCLMEDRTIAHIHVSWLAPVKVRRTLIGGGQQMIVYDDLEPSEKVKVYDRGVTVSESDNVYQMLVGYRTGDMWAPKLSTTEALQNEARHFVQCVAQNQQPDTDGDAGLRVVRILEAADLSLKQKGLPIELNWERMPV
jgi:predicted dehydrogenase